MFYNILNILSEKMSKITVECKNDLEISGNLISVDNNLNIALSNISVLNVDNYPQFLNMKSCFIRGNTIRYIHLNPNQIDYKLVEEACRKKINNE